MFKNKKGKKLIEENGKRIGGNRINSLKIKNLKIQENKKSHHEASCDCGSSCGRECSSEDVRVRESSREGVCGHRCLCEVACVHGSSLPI